MEWEILVPQQYQEIMTRYQVGSLLAKVLCFGLDNRHVQVPLRGFECFKDANKALSRIEQAIAKHEKVAIYGDYDCDGIMATTILVRAFELRGMAVGYHIPDRFVDGYGLNIRRVEEMAKRGYTLIITVDNGISAFDAIQRANELGVDVIVTDHHDLPHILPPAYAIIHTQFSPDYPFKAISGGFVACKLATAMLSRQDPYIYCLASLSTVSDMMPMVDENRTLVKKALQVMNQQHYLSLDLLLGENQSYNTNGLGFVIAPKINSIGRLNEGMNPNKCVTYFRHSGANSEVERDFKMKFANTALKMNQARQRLTTSQYDEAKENMQELSGAILSASPHFHEGLVGLVAGKMMNAYYRPSLVVKKDEESGLYKGSARSIAGIDMHDVLQSCSEHLLVFGGHEKAGGFTVKKDRWDDFVKNLDQYFAHHLTEELLIEKRRAILLEETDLSLTDLKEMARLEPFGQENEEPTFCLRVSSPTKIETLGNGKHLKLYFSLPRTNLQVLWFNHGEEYERLSQKDHFELFGQLSINKFRNFENAQMIIKEIR